MASAVKAQPRHISITQACDERNQQQLTTLNFNGGCNALQTSLAFLSDIQF